MDTKIGRRDFMKTAGVTAGAALAAGYSAKARATTD
ncbi:MAG: twin-arginine translocation signal domain-containing protein, partial [Candidatus Hydrogenedentes bacterium]|nr:twin-arginine translocation signal domain-containing protein [Candidatus Hydrogenedentota bacterium]